LAQNWFYLKKGFHSKILANTSITYEQNTFNLPRHSHHIDAGTPFALFWHAGISGRQTAKRTVQKAVLCAKPIFGSA